MPHLSPPRRHGHNQQDQAERPRRHPLPRRGYTQALRDRPQGHQVRAIPQACLPPQDGILSPDALPQVRAPPQARALPPIQLPTSILPPARARNAPPSRNGPGRTHAAPEANPAAILNNMIAASSIHPVSHRVFFVIVKRVPRSLLRAYHVSIEEEPDTVTSATRLLATCSEHTLARTPEMETAGLTFFVVNQDPLAAAGRVARRLFGAGPALSVADPELNDILLGRRG